LHDCVTAPPRLQLALTPTPLLKLDRLSRRLGVGVYLKRDDLTGLLEHAATVSGLPGDFLRGEGYSV
jgi:hypothetical protein